MAGFVFRLERALAWRRTELRRQEALLERCQAQVTAVEIALAEYLEARHTAAIRVHGQVVIRGGELQDFELFNQGVEVRVKECQVRLSQATEQMEKQRLATIEAKRRVRLMETLREGRQFEWQQDANLQIENQAGEFALARWSQDQEAAGEAPGEPMV